MNLAKRIQEKTLTRRSLFGVAALAGSALVLPSSLQAAVKRQERNINFYHSHTGESLRTTYWADGHYIPESLTEANHVLRDHYSGETTTMDAGLLDILYLISEGLDFDGDFEVISGYRSAQTNAMLRQRGRGVARHSMHIEGKAIDFRCRNRSLTQIRKVAMSIQGGGVGYYPSSCFVHIDTGLVRYW